MTELSFVWSVPSTIFLNSYFGLVVLLLDSTFSIVFFQLAQVLYFFFELIDRRPH